MRHPTINIREVLHLIRPNAECVLVDNDYETLDWHDETQAKPTMEEIEAGQEELARLSYREERRPLYPSVSEFADAFVHFQNGNPAPMAAYVEKCNAVKAQFPKPE